jgi:hypothetical protein
MFEFINLLPNAGEFIATLAAWFLPALVAGLLVAWGLAMSNDTSILDDFIVWDEQGSEMVTAREGQVMRLLCEQEAMRQRIQALEEENLFLREELRALARENDHLRYPEEIRVKVIDLREVIDLSEVEVRLLEAHLDDTRTYARA